MTDYFDSAYFDEAYFDTDSASPTPEPPSPPRGVRIGPVKPKTKPVVDDDWLVLIL